jgi:hypothetical protein
MDRAATVHCEARSIADNGVAWKMNQTAFKGGNGDLFRTPVHYPYSLVIREVVAVGIGTASRG